MLNPYFPYHEPGFDAWKQRLEALPHSEVLVREANQTAQDGRWMRWIQADCESTNIQSVELNVSKIGKQLVFLAEIAECPIGFCYVLVGQTNYDPLFIQLVAVVRCARRQGVGLALLSAAATREPHCNIAMATLDDNVAARRLNERFAQSVGGEIQRVPDNHFRPSDLGFAPDECHRPWLIVRK